MHGPDRRRFTITDAMVLVAATALGMAWMRVVYPDESRPQSGNYVRWLLHGPSTCLAVTWAAALILLRLCGARPRRRRLVIQPGLVACVTVLISLLLGLGCGLFFRAVHTFGPSENYVYSTGVFWSWAIGAAPGVVLGA